MDAFRTCLVALTLLTAPDTASTDPRMPPQGGGNIVPTVAPEDWLGQLPGIYRVEGLVNVVAREECAYCVAATGTADCIRIGQGSGVQCVFNVRWEETHEFVQPAAELPQPGEPVPPAAGAYELPGGVPYLSPAVMLFGRDPGQHAILHLAVNNKGLSEGGPGFVAGNRATFRTACVNGPRVMGAMKPPPKPPQPPKYEVAWRTCDRIVRIDAKPGANVVFITIELAINDDPFTLINLTLRRMPSLDAAS
jgi:hypothetical protein